NVRGRAQRVRSARRAPSARFRGGSMAQVRGQARRGFRMSPLRALVCSLGLGIALSPVAAFAETSDHAPGEGAHGVAQLQQAQQTVTDMQDQASLSAANDRMIGVLQSEALRERQLNMTANANAMEQIASALANAARAQGDVNARNELGIAQIKAAALVSTA